jgi:hypothetical protein
MREGLIEIVQIPLPLQKAVGHPEFSDAANDHPAHSGAFQSSQQIRSHTIRVHFALTVRLTVNAPVSY